MTTTAYRPSRPSLQLGVLECWSHVPHAVELAEEADRLGYSRYWLTEHPGQPNPQMLAALLAGVTDRIRVGTAGILLHHHVPLQAAQQFLLLEHVFPGRIDAGYCAGSARELMAEALRDGRPAPGQDPMEFDRRAAELIGFLRGDFPADHHYAPLVPWIESTGVPEIWTFGTGERSADLAARHGTSFGYSLFHNFSRDDTANVDRYREAFQPSAAGSEPAVVVAVAGVCAATEQEAQRLRQGHANPFLVPTIVGTPRQCRERLEAVAERYGTRELVFMDLSPDFASRLRSYELLAEELELPAADGSATIPNAMVEDEMESTIAFAR